MVGTKEMRSEGEVARAMGVVTVGGIHGKDSGNAGLYRGGYFNRMWRGKAPDAGILGAFSLSLFQ